MAATFTWGGRTWGAGDLDAFRSWLSAHGGDWGTWAANHPEAQSILMGGATFSDANSTGGYGAPASSGGGDTGGATQSDANSTGGYGAPNDSTGGSTNPIDWSSLLGLYGMPQDIINELNNIFSRTTDITQAITLAQAYVRGTDWYTQTFPGIQDGINAGLFTDEKGYQAYKSQVNQLYQQYFGRDATGGEIAGYLTQGWNPSRVANSMQAKAIQGNLSDPLKGLFTPDELTALANEMAGIDSALGQKIQSEANLFSQVQLMYQNFYGRDPTRADLDQLTKDGTSPQQIAQNFAVQDNINAMNPAIKDLFTPDEIKQVAIEEAGGTTQNGLQLKNLMDLATQLNPLYHQYTGAGVSRAEVEQTLASGYSPTQVGQQLSGTAWEKANEGDIQLSAGAFADQGQFSADQLKALGFQEGGFDTQLGQQVLAAYQKAQQRMQGAFKGVLANPALSLTTGRLAGQKASQAPDIAA